MVEDRSQVGLLSSFQVEMVIGFLKIDPFFTTVKKDDLVEGEVASTFPID